jgi:hypothetical protein
MRTVGSAVLLCAVLAACQPASEPVEEQPTLEELGQDEPGVPLPEVDTTPVTWEALSKTAESFTGPITVAQLPYTGPNDTASIRIEAATGLIYEADLIPVDSSTFADWRSILSVPEGQPVPEISVYSIATETVPEGTPNGGFCAKTFALAIAHVTRDGIGETMTIAPFGGDVWPPAAETDLCGTFNYVKPAAAP